jgi:hypothetical protein
MGTMRSAAMDRHPEVVKRQRIFEGRKVALEVHHIRAPDGRISDAKTVAAILFWDRFRRGTG